MNTKFDTKKKVLLHVCCAVCSATTIKILYDKYEISFYWYNPNIYDIQEYKNRKNAAIKYSEELNIPFYEEKDFSYNYFNWKNESFEKCIFCYKLRIEKTAIFAKKNRFDFFSTSLLSSPHQKHDIVKQIAINFTYKYTVEFLYKDFRKYFYDAKNSLKKRGYYIQKYCGCNKSLKQVKSRQVEVA
ncbi:MAG: epoxyqueuosine reductase QueH [Endomicrobium sp.]|jgi:predicted adenine nucleotide alpha hydrolase (AANH) superfamily ATPase|nr:epoxyqueuosine reductase QueH [Endomicrobium sp.]